MRAEIQLNQPAPDPVSPVEADARQDEVMIAYLPIVRGAAIAVLGYYLFDLATRFFFPGDAYPAVMMTAVAMGSLWSIGILYLLRNPRKVWHLEVYAAMVCMALFFNSNLQQSLYFEVENVTYAILMIPIFAAILPTRRMIVAGIVLCFVSLIWQVHTYLPDQVFDYFWVGVSGIAAGIAISEIIRTAVLNSVKARLAVVRDREKAEALARETRHLAECDALTGLPNRRSFFLALNTHVEHLKQTGDAFFLGLVDLDGFKPVNDTYGHAAGDEMLRIVARRLEEAGGSAAFPARLGGDEFAILAPANPKTAQAILSLGHKIEARLSEPYDLGDYTCKGSGSVGLLICDDPELAAHDLMERADHALYFAKRALQGRAVLFNAALEREMTTSSQVDKALRKADYDREFSVVFQPQYDLLKSRITGFEALARWDSPELGRVTPDVFIPAAERAGLIRPLTRTLLSKALDTMLDWPDETSLSFNLSTHDLMSPNAIEAILTTVRDSGIPAKRIEFEITETAMMSDFNQARRAIDQINRAGHSVALDDFGIGYSSLQYLQQLPVSKLKIDHSFVSSILEDTSSYKIVRTLLSLSRTLDLGCVIEGVETEAQLHILRTMGARHIQGYLIGQPMPADQVAPALTQKFDFSPRPMPQPRKAAQS